MSIQERGDTGKKYDTKDTQQMVEKVYVRDSCLKKNGARKY